MRIQIDTKEKTIRILTRTNLAELVEALEKMLGDDYLEYDLDVLSTYIPWTNPIYYNLKSDGTYTIPTTGTHNIQIGGIT